VTAAAVEDDQADAPALSPREEHLAEWLEVMAAADKLLRQVIADELAEDMPGLEQAQAEAAKGVEETYAALQGPERDLADLDGEITGAETELATWQSQLEEGDVAARSRPGAGSPSGKPSWPRYGANESSAWRSCCRSATRIARPAQRSGRPLGHWKAGR
jgi:hypothetical protein